MGTHQNLPDPQLFSQGQQDEEVGLVGNGAPAPLPEPVGVDSEEAGETVPGQVLLLEPFQTFGEVRGKLVIHPPVYPPLASQSLSPRPRKCSPRWGTGRPCRPEPAAGAT